MNIFFYILIFLILNINLFATNTFFSISVCTTSSKDSANNCKNDISESTKENIFIIKDEKDNQFRTYLGSFDSYADAKKFLNSSSSFIKKQKPFIKELKKEPITGIKTLPLIPTPEIKDEYKLLEAFYLKGLSKDPIIEKPKKENISKTIMLKIEDFNSLIVEVDSNKNIMFLKGEENKKLTNIKSYKVSTARTNIKKPLGIGDITAISLEPIWYPTQKTLKAFRQKGINLPSAVPYGHRLNYMGAAKINLSHRVNGNEVYRIHGTINEETIGTYESSGCIRMKNNEVVELASLLNNFASIKSFDNIKVVLK
jgi:L,D-transpeptidase YcfS